MAFATTFRHSPTEPVRGREVDANLDALGVYVDGTFLPLAGGTMSGNIAMGGNILTGLGAGAAAGNSVRYEQVKVLKVVSATSTTQSSTTSSTFASTNLTASITPASSSNSVLIVATGTLTNNSLAACVSGMAIFRGSTNLGASAGFVIINGSSAGVSLAVPAAIVYLDSPATTSSTTYTVKIRSSDNATSTSLGGANQTQSIVLLEINGA